MFDPSTFLDQQIDTPMSTARELCPEGEFPAIIDDFDATAFKRIEGKDGKPDRVVFSCPFVIQDEAVKTKLERDKVVVRKDCWLDQDAAGGLLTGKNDNVDLGLIRAAVGQNEGPWNFGMLRGAGPCIVRVRHRSTDKNDPERKIAEVSRVVPLR